MCLFYHIITLKSNFKLDFLFLLLYNLNMEKLYQICENKITIKDLKQFNITHILECGQVFRYKKLDDGYFVISGENCAKIMQNESFCEIICSDVDYFVNYFDLNTNYNEIKNKLANFSELKPMLEFGYGLRILRQDPTEMILSFIISANNNIKRIQNSVNKISEKFGKLCKFGGIEYYSFPKLNELKKATEEDFKNFGTGYRAKYLVSAVEELENLDYKKIDKLTSEEASKILLNIKGVGQKVCDCILLFGFNKQDCFPVDTWIRKVYFIHFNSVEKEKQDKISEKQIRKDLVNIFKNLSGYAQQYLFYFERTFN